MSAQIQKTPLHVVKAQAVKGWRPAVRNQSWCKHEDGTFSAEASDLDCNGNTDPWNRPLNLLNKKEHRDADRDVIHWTGTTTIAGVPVKLIIWND